MQTTYPAAKAATDQAVATFQQLKATTPRSEEEVTMAGKLIGALVTIFDLLLQHLSEEALAESANKLNENLPSTDDMMALIVMAEIYEESEVETNITPEIVAEWLLDETEWMLIAQNNHSALVRFLSRLNYAVSMPQCGTSLNQTMKDWHRCKA